eukprot:9038467-Alexandrium_andersonii.AAC.1
MSVLAPSARDSFPRPSAPAFSSLPPRPRPRVRAALPPRAAEGGRPEGPTAPDDLVPAAACALPPVS